MASGVTGFSQPVESKVIKVDGASSHSFITALILKRSLFCCCFDSLNLFCSAAVSNFKFNEFLT